MNRALSALWVLAPGQAQAQPRGRDGVAPTKTPVVVVVTQRADARVALVREAVAHWNRVLAGIGSSFRPGPVSIRSGAEATEPGKIVAVLSDGVFISDVNRLRGGQGALVMIRSDRVAAAVAAQCRSQCHRTLARTCNRPWPQQRSGYDDVRTANLSFTHQRSGSGIRQGERLPRGRDAGRDGVDINDDLR